MSARFLSISQVAELSGVSTSTVRRWITASALPVHRFGRQIRIDRHDLERFIERCRDGGDGAAFKECKTNQ